MKIFRYILLFTIVFVSSITVKAQSKSEIKKTVDSLLIRFTNSVYTTYYRPSHQSYITTVTMLKFDLDTAGKVVNVSFSDSADSIFVKNYKNDPYYKDDTSTLEKYAAIKNLVSVSLMFPIYYEPGYPKQGRKFSYPELESIMKFGGQSFSGNSIIFPFIRIAKLAMGNE